jgi:hypothetical protein
MFASNIFHNIKLTEASTFDDLTSTPFFIKFNSTDNDESYGEVCFHLENAPLALALVKAINETLAAFATSVAPETPERDPLADDEISF